MFSNFVKTAWRNLVNSKGYSIINIVGLAAGMAVALLIGLWVWDELSFDRYYRQYDRLAEVMDVQTINGEAGTDEAIAMPLADALRTKYGSEFKRIAMVYPPFTHTVAVGDKKVSEPGEWVEPDLPEMLTLKMAEGERGALRDPSSVLLTRSLAVTLFGKTDPINQPVRIDNMTVLRVAGVFEDFPPNTSWSGVKLFLAWDKALNTLPGLKQFQKHWDIRYWKLYVELNSQVDIGKASASIKDIPGQYLKGNHEELFLHPMSKWHLYNEFKNGKVSGGRIRLVRLVGSIGAFVLLLACINFMNLSTARSAGRAKEVGIRKAIGSGRGQLIIQFFGESLLVSILAACAAICAARLSLPFFNRLTDKQMAFPYAEPLFLVLCAGFTLLSGFVAGSYPALYLSGFRPIKVLKGNFVAGTWGTLPRKVLIVVQFIISISLVIGTMIVYKQIRHARDRPVGYSRAGLLAITMSTMDIYGAPYQSLRNELLRSGAVADMAKASIHATETPYSITDVSWEGKPAGATPLIAMVTVTHDFGHTIDWHIEEGRDFSRSYPGDSSAVILNAAAAKLTGLQHPVGKRVVINHKEHPIIGVAGDMIMESPYQPVQPTIFFLDYDILNALMVRIKPNVPVREALAKTEAVFKKFDPAGAFSYHFTDEEYAKKFATEERIGGLALFGAVLAIFISCLGLFGLASFTAEQRTKEIGIRKVLGASVASVWNLLLREFMRLIVLSFLIASPVMYYFMHQWLQNYTYRTGISWWIFAAACAGILLIALLTVSYQAIRTARMNPVDSIRAD